MSQNKTIVVVGGGYAGVAVLDELHKKRQTNVNVILISRNNYFFHNVGSPRALVEEASISKICIPFDMKMKQTGAKFIHGKVVTISYDQRKLNYLAIVDNKEDREETLSFDYLVLAFGSIQQWPFQANQNEKEKQVNSLQDVNNKIKQAKRVLFVGGGAVGSETAGEFASDFPDKKITLLTNGDRLLSTMDNAFSTRVLNILKEKNVDVIFNDRVELANVENFKTQRVKTKNGKEIEFDAYFVCTGIKPYKEILENSGLSAWLNPNGYVKVKNTLQVADEKNVFALGDCCDLGPDEPKLAYKTTGNYLKYIMKLYVYFLYFFRRFGIFKIHFRFYEIFFGCILSTHFFFYLQHTKKTFSHINQFFSDTPIFFHTKIDQKTFSHTNQLFSHEISNKKLF
jgi:NADH dehydrogenase FAD-containing subunit